MKTGLAIVRLGQNSEKQESLMTDEMPATGF